MKPHRLIRVILRGSHRIEGLQKDGGEYVFDDGFSHLGYALPLFHMRVWEGDPVVIEEYNHDGSLLWIDTYFVSAWTECGERWKWSRMLFKNYGATTGAQRLYATLARAHSQGFTHVDMYVDTGDGQDFRMLKADGNKVVGHHIYATDPADPTYGRVLVASKPD